MEIPKNGTPEELATFFYGERCQSRYRTLCNSTVSFINYFIERGDDESAAKNKVTQISTQIAPYLYAYVLGNTQPLIDSMNNSDLPFMDASAKQYAVSKLQIENNIL